MCDYLCCGYLRALAPARNVRVSALRVSPQGLWDKGQQVADPSASSSIGRILVKLLLKISSREINTVSLSDSFWFGEGMGFNVCHCGHFKETTTLHAHTQRERETDTGRKLEALPPSLAVRDNHC